MAALRLALGQPDDFPNCALPVELGLGDVPLEYAIYWSPLGFIADLIGLGAAVNYGDPAGFPCLIAALSTDRADRNALLLLLLMQGADVYQRGLNGQHVPNCCSSTPRRSSRRHTISWSKSKSDFVNCGTILFRIRHCNPDFPARQAPVCPANHALQQVTLHFRRDSASADRG